MGGEVGALYKSFENQRKIKKNHQEYHKTQGNRFPKASRRSSMMPIDFPDTPGHSPIEKVGTSNLSHSRCAPPFEIFTGGHSYPDLRGGAFDGFVVLVYLIMPVRVADTMPSTGRERKHNW